MHGFVSYVVCMSFVLKCTILKETTLDDTNNLRRFDSLRHRRFNWCKKVQFLSVTFTDSSVQVIIDNLFIILCSFFVSAIDFEKEVHQHELVRVETLRKKA